MSLFIYTMCMALKVKPIMKLRCHGAFNAHIYYASCSRDGIIVRLKSTFKGKDFS
jgi:hypothetical protein